MCSCSALTASRRWSTPRRSRRSSRRNKSNLDAAAHGLIKAANARGGDDNITAILFAVADGDADLTQELPAPSEPAADPDDEDTLHPEDNVRLPDLDAPPPT